MSVETKYTCDRCGAVQYKPEQFWVVRVQVTTLRETFSAYGGGPSKQWCRKCCEAFGILPTIHPPATFIEPPTFEDLVREIVREETRT